MSKIVNIKSIIPYKLICLFDTGETKSIDVKPLLDKQKHLPGVSSLLEIKNFEQVQIGETGELVWRKIVRFSDTEIWDYDVSPELAYQLGEPIEAMDASYVK